MADTSLYEVELEIADFEHRPFLLEACQIHFDMIGESILLGVNCG